MEDIVDFDEMAVKMEDATPGSLPFSTKDVDVEDGLAPLGVGEDVGAWEGWADTDVAFESPEIVDDGVPSASDFHQQEPSPAPLLVPAMDVRPFSETHAVVPQGSPFELIVTGVPDKWRADKQFRICLQLVEWGTTKLVGQFSQLKLPADLMARKTRQLKQVPVRSVDKPAVYADISVVCASDASHDTIRCFSCVQRERRMEERLAAKRRHRSGSHDAPPPNGSIEWEQRRIILLYSSSDSVAFDTGECIIPVRLTCYCRHHFERVGFRIHITLHTADGTIVANAITTPVLVTDDHKPARPAKRKKADEGGQPEEPQSNEALIRKLAPAEGPVAGGIEVAVIGSSLIPGLSCLFGVNEAQTAYWGPNTLMCVLPPAAHPGSVTVSLMKAGMPHGHCEEVFLYEDAGTDLALMQLALQIIGQKLTGRLDDARAIAQQILEESQQEEMVAASASGDGGGTANSLSVRILGHAVEWVGSRAALDQQLQCALKETTKRSGFDVWRVLEFLFDAVLAMDTGHPVDLRVQNTVTGHTVLHFAALAGHMGFTSTVLSVAGEPRQQSDLVVMRDVNGYTPLHFAAMNGQTAVLTVLVSAISVAGETRPEIVVDVLGSLTDGSRVTPLFLAAAAGSKDCVQVLLEAERVALSKIDPWIRVNLSLSSAAEIECHHDEILPEALAIEPDLRRMIKDHRVQYALRRQCRWEGVVELALRQQAAWNWIRVMLGLDCSVNTDLSKSLQDGVILARIASKFRPAGESAKKLYKDAAKAASAEQETKTTLVTPPTQRPRSSSFVSFENHDRAEAFLSDCRALGVEAIDLFSPNDLCEQKNIVMVLSTIFALARVVKCDGASLSYESLGLNVSASFVKSASQSLQRASNAEEAVKLLSRRRGSVRDAVAVIEEDSMDMDCEDVSESDESSEPSKSCDKDQPEAEVEAGEGMRVTTRRSLVSRQASSHAPGASDPATLHVDQDDKQDWREGEGKDNGINPQSEAVNIDVPSGGASFGSAVKRVVREAVVLEEITVEEPQTPLKKRGDSDWEVSVDQEWETLDLTPSNVPWFRIPGRWKVVSGTKTYLGYNVLGISLKYWSLFFVVMVLVSLGAGVTPVQRGFTAPSHPIPMTIARSGGAEEESMKQGAVPPSPDLEGSAEAEETEEKKKALVLVDKPPGPERAGSPKYVVEDPSVPDESPTRSEEGEERKEKKSEKGDRRETEPKQPNPAKDRPKVAASEGSEPHPVHESEETVSLFHHENPWKYALLGVWCGASVLFLCGSVYHLKKTVHFCRTPRGRRADRRKTARDEFWDSRDQVAHASRHPRRVVALYVAVTGAAMAQVITVFHILWPLLYDL